MLEGEHHLGDGQYNPLSISLHSLSTIYFHTQTQHFPSLTWDVYGPVVLQVTVCLVKVVSSALGEDQEEKKQEGHLDL